ncbi:hypothetical protein [Macrococcoides canis]|uniref:Uncharacterized protein n=1 Tax=Macrococcoides canis TaxID=1855823 RepID=A0A4R6C6S2_9STAP|nr:hypothetical protein [Macrococcus canis]TDM18143.1 hypothetical protein ETI04_01235 [Macrococcus canis]TDM32741.1 hypothetical protein ETI03_03305 [Macrococcus canis]
MENDKIESFKDVQIQRERDKREIYKYIDDVDDKHTKNYHLLDKAITLFSESQKPLVKSLTNIEGQMVTLNDTMSGFKGEVDKLKGKVDSHEEFISKRKNANDKIIVAIIGAFATIGGSAFAFAQVFFK